MRHSQTPLDTGSGSNSPPIAHRGTAGRDYAYGYRYELRRRDTACRHWREERALASWDWVDLGAFAGAKKLEQVWLALRRHYDVHVAGTPRAADQIDLYLQRSATVNAYAAGGRSVAVSSGALREFLARRLSGDRMRAVLVHELGHHSTGGTRFSLVVLWLAMPWRAASRLVLVLCYGLAGRRQPLALLGIVVLAAVGIAVGKAVQHGQWAAAAVLSGLIVRRRMPDRGCLRGAAQRVCS